VYTGREYDVETDIHHYRARHYQSGMARFLTRDPIGYEGIEWNLYEYVAGVPLDKVDPRGQAAEAADAAEYTDADVVFCKKKLEDAAKGFVTSIVYPCARQLLRYFLRLDVRPGGDICPQVCHDAARGFWYEHLMSSLKKIPDLKCDGQGKISDAQLAGGGKFGGHYETYPSDLALAIHGYRYTIRAEGSWKCGSCHYNLVELDPYGEKFDEFCSCRCDATVSVDATLTDTYDFLDKNGHLVGKRRGFPWCGGVLEKEGIGKKFPVKCSYHRKNAKLTWYIECEDPGPDFGDLL
jgi:RHS repeat-associated protein